MARFARPLQPILEERPLCIGLSPGPFLNPDSGGLGRTRAPGSASASPARPHGDLTATPACPHVTAWPSWGLWAQSTAESQTPQAPLGTGARPGSPWWTSGPWTSQQSFKPPQSVTGAEANRQAAFSQVPRLTLECIRATADPGACCGGALALPFCHCLQESGSAKEVSLAQGEWSPHCG